MPDLLGAAGGSLGLIDDGELVIIDPGAATRAALQPGLRLPLSTRAPIAAAARTGKPAYANTRGELERVYPDGARLVRYAASSLAVPIKVAGEVVGSTGFPFAHPHAVDDDMIALATVAAEAGGQALERARLHELEQSQRVKAELAAERTRLLQDVAEHLSAAGTAAEVGEVIVGQAAGVMAADAVLVYECDADRRQLRAARARRLLGRRRRSETGRAAGCAVTRGGRRRVGPAAAVAHANADPRALRRMFSRLRSSRTRSRRTAFRSRPGRGRSAPCASSIALRRRSTPASSPSPARSSSRAPSRSTAVSATRRSASPAGARSVCRRSPPACRARSRQATSAAIFIDEVIDAIGADAAALSVVDADTGQMHPVAWRGVPDELIEERGVPLARRPARAPRRSAGGGRRTTRSVEHLAADFPRSRERAEASGMRDVRVSAAVGSRLARRPRRARLARARRASSADDRPFLEAIAGQCALALDRARRYEAERDIAETLQRSVLPETLPSMEGVRVAALYLPGSSAVDVGGDWFDTLTLADGSLGFVVGDVVGKGVEAAATMAQLRNGMRALTLDRRTPGETVTKLNLLLASYTDVPFATLAYVTLDPRTLDGDDHARPAIRRRSWSQPDGERSLPRGARRAAARRRPGRVVHRVAHDPRAGRDGRALHGRPRRASRPVDRRRARPPGPGGRGERRGSPTTSSDAVVEELLGPRCARRRRGAARDPPRRRSARPARAHAAGRHGVAQDACAPSSSGGSPMPRYPIIDARDVVLASWEAGANAIEHAHAPEGSSFQPRRRARRRPYPRRGGRRGPLEGAVPTGEQRSWTAVDRGAHGVGGRRSPRHRHASRDGAPAEPGARTERRPTIGDAK